MNVLAVGAHFDDIELGCSGTLINHKNHGDNVNLLVITKSGYTDPNGKVVRTDETAEKEGKQAAEIIGANLFNLGFKTFEFGFDESVTKEITKIIEKLSIDLVYCPWIHDIHRDHQNAGKAAIMASRHINKVLMFRPNYYDSYQSFNGNFYSNISKVFDKKINVIKAHKSELERVRNSWINFFKRQNANDGQKIGVKYAECFEIVRYLM